MNSIENEVKILYDKVPAPKPEQKKGLAGISIKIYLLVGIPLVLALFYNGESVYWFNQDVKELAAVYAGAIQMERECKRRDDLLPNLINITREYAKHEQSLFQYVSEMRSQIGPAAGMHGNSPAGNSGDLLAKLIALSEQYPDLKATQSFQDLMDMMETTEDRIATARDNYVYAVYRYNLCNQRFWCPFFTTIINWFCPMPTFVDYYYYKSHLTGKWAKLQAPEMVQDEITEKEKNELIQPTPFRGDSLGLSSSFNPLPHKEEESK
jgi:LemA protein